METEGSGAPSSNRGNPSRLSLMRGPASSHVRHREEIIQNERERPLEARSHLEGRAAQRDAVRPRREQAPLRLLRDDRLNQTPRLRNFAADDDYFRVQSVNQP